MWHVYSVRPGDRLRAVTYRKVQVCPCSCHRWVGGDVGQTLGLLYQLVNGLCGAHMAL
jgi:tetrahydromethanopterin S-methyltransferase subunit G